ncbi:hypothetical protein [Corynebacterium meridianum]|uniref:Uncharacterized protein n=1 Tax=Corynebacterium meridianum TaxID=2765363 RepID=A0A934M6M1_9CORY|nr:hypothetical protein [Corynebacterium meridianum]MBI8988744.1 hypothetical protein [Corynebacterium meridianum]
MHTTITTATTLTTTMGMTATTMPNPVKITKITVGTATTIMAGAVEIDR